MNIDCFDSMWVAVLDRSHSLFPTTVSNKIHYYMIQEQHHLQNTVIISIKLVLERGEQQ